MDIEYVDIVTREIFFAKSTKIFVNPFLHG